MEDRRGDLVIRKLLEGEVLSLNVETKELGETLGVLRRSEDFADDIDLLSDQVVVEYLACPKTNLLDRKGRHGSGVRNRGAKDETATLLLYRPSEDIGVEAGGIEVGVWKARGAEVLGNSVLALVEGDVVLWFEAVESREDKVLDTSALGSVHGIDALLGLAGFAFSNVRTDESLEDYSVS